MKNSSAYIVVGYKMKNEQQIEKIKRDLEELGTDGNFGFFSQHNSNTVTYIEQESVGILGEAILESKNFVDEILPVSQEKFDEIKKKIMHFTSNLNIELPLNFEVKPYLVLWTR